MTTDPSKTAGTAIERFQGEIDDALAGLVVAAVDAHPFDLGVEKTVSVLVGKRFSFALEHDLFDHPGYGALAFLSREEVRSLIGRLTTVGFLTKERLESSYGHPVLRVTDEGRRSLDHGASTTLSFARDVLAREGVSLTRDQEDLYGKLRALRKQLATTNDVPAYLVCDDETLFRLVQQAPTDGEELEAIHGIGPAFVEDHGELFLDRIRDSIDGGTTAAQAPASSGTMSDKEEGPR